MGTTNLSLGIEISEPNIKLALFDQKQNKVLRLGSIDVSTHPLRDVASLESVIAEWAAEAPGLQASQITVTLPTNMCVVRRVEMPKGIPNKREYIEWEFSTAINSLRNDYLLDFHEISNKANSVAMVAAVRKSWLEPMRKGMSNRELMPSQVEVDAFSLLNLFEAGLIGTRESLSCIIKVDRTGVVIVWGKDGVLQTMQWLNVAPLANMRPEQAFQALCSGLLSKLDAGARQLGYPDASGHLVHLCGDLAINEEFVKQLKSFIPKVTFTVLSSLHRIQLESGFAVSEGMVPLCAAAIGAALRRKEDRK